MEINYELLLSFFPLQIFIIWENIINKFIIFYETYIAMTFVDKFWGTSI